MQRLLFSLLFAALFFPALFFPISPAHAQSEDRLPWEASADRANAVIPDTSWTSFASQGGRYTVDFPGSPTDTSMVNPSASGPMTSYMRIFELNDGVLISAYTPLNVGLTDAQTDSMLTNIAANLGGRVGVAQTSVDTTSFEGYPGRIVTQAGTGGPVMQWRVFIVGPYLYQISHLGESERPELTERFFDSFAFTMPADSIAALSPTRPALEERLEALGWTYEVEDESRYKMILQIDSTRSQLVYAEELTDPISENTRFHVWAPVGFFEDAPSPEFLLDLLSQNGDVELGAFRSYTNEEGYYIAFVVDVDAMTDAETMEGVFFFAGETADAAEAEWVGGDEY